MADAVLANQSIDLGQVFGKIDQHFIVLIFYIMCINTANGTHAVNNGGDGAVYALGVFMLPAFKGNGGSADAHVFTIKKVDGRSADVVKHTHDDGSMEFDGHANTHIVFRSNGKNTAMGRGGVQVENYDFFRGMGFYLFSESADDVNDFLLMVWYTV